jgi:hypothetical protein
LEKNILAAQGRADPYAIDPYDIDLDEKAADR